MVVTHRQNIFKPGIDPLFTSDALAFRAMSIAAGIIFLIYVTAVIALIKVVSKRISAAIYNRIND
jgi:hypothetical protein